MSNYCHVKDILYHSIKNDKVEKSIREYRHELRLNRFLRKYIDDWGLILPLIQQILKADENDIMSLFNTDFVWQHSQLGQENPVRYSAEKHW